MRTGDISSPWTKHTDACRQRVEAALREHPDLADKIIRADARRDAYLEQRFAERDRHLPLDELAGGPTLGASSPSASARNAATSASRQAHPSCAGGEVHREEREGIGAKPEPKRHRGQDEIPMPTAEGEDEMPPNRARLSVHHGQRTTSRGNRRAHRPSRRGERGRLAAC